MEGDRGSNLTAPPQRAGQEQEDDQHQGGHGEQRKGGREARDTVGAIGGEEEVEDVGDSRKNGKCDALAGGEEHVLHLTREPQH